MKKIILLIAALPIISSSFKALDDQITVKEQVMKISQWQWSSGEVRSKGIADEGSTIDITFDPSLYKEGDKVKITFNSFKVTISGLTPGTTFDKWEATVNLACQDGNGWADLAAVDKKMNKKFSNKNNDPSDVKVNYAFDVKVPADGKLRLTVHPDGVFYSYINGNGKPMFKNGYGTLIIDLKGVEVQKM